MTKFVYAFEECNAGMRNLLGGKGANLAEMTSLGLPIPSGFTITTDACMNYLNNHQGLSSELKHEVAEYLRDLELKTDKSFSNNEKLLLVSVRSGARASMPGMMDTVLNLGLNDENVEKFAEATANPTFAYDCYRRLLQMFGNVVYGIDSSRFERQLTQYKDAHQLASDQDLSVEDLKVVVALFKDIYTDVLGHVFPQDPVDQLYAAIEAVFASWQNERAKVYRKLNDIPADWGTAVNVQEMVFGNTGWSSGTGVAFTRNPSTGENVIFGEYLMNAQGEDVVAGIRTPHPIGDLKEAMPGIYQQFEDISTKLEHHYGDMQDIEFTIEDGNLFILQTRNGKRTAKAAFKVAVDMVEEGLSTIEQALLKIDPNAVHQILHPTFEPDALKDGVLVSSAGLPASPGAATGHIVFDAETAVEQTNLGQPVILVRHETSPEDISGMAVSEAIVTSRGGMTSHAAVVARGMGVCCVAGSEDLEIDVTEKRVTYPGGILQEGDVISVDGTNGVVYLGDIAKVPTEGDASFQKILVWAEDQARLKVRMNAETVGDIKAGLSFNAAGIGLARTEHMFFQEERLKEMRHFILTDSETVRQAALEKIMHYQIEDFKAIFALTESLPVTIRLLDPPLHEFLPHTTSDIQLVADQQGVSVAHMQQRIQELQETNPMLGHRGCRLAITYPTLYLMQAEAIIRAAASLIQEGVVVKPEIMVPLVGMKAELDILTNQIKAHLLNVLDEIGVAVNYTIGTMVELPRACLTADELAENTDFFSFGTNDLTQMTYGFSRDDAGKFISEYLADGILTIDPFQTIDVDGVGQLVKTATKLGRSTKPDLKVGVCGELGGDPKSVAFFHDVGLDYVSCSPFRIPVAKIAAAQANILAKNPVTA